MAFNFFKKDKGKDTSKISKDDLEVSDEEAKLVDKVKTLYKEAYSAKSDLHAKWEKCYKAYTGDLFKQNLPDYRADEVSNYVFSTIETVKPIMLNDSPKTQVIPRQGSMFQKAKVANAILDSEWKRTRMFNKLHSINHLNLIFGTAIAGCFWDGKAKNGLGDVVVTAISPFNCFPEPSATNMEDAEYFIYATYKKSSEICNAYPEKAEEIKKQTTSDVDKYLTFGSSDNQGNNNILYLECYMRDYSSEEYTEDKEENGEKLTYKVTKRKYPNGRRIIIAGDVLLVDDKNPYEDGSFPFKVLKCYPQHGSFWGIGEVEMLISPQQYANKIMNSVIENAQLNGNPWTVMDKNCGVERNTLTNAPGLVVRKNPGTEFKREAPPPIPSYIIDTVGVLKRDMEQISGVYDVIRGEKPGSITAASAIQALNEQAQGRIRLKVQNLEDFISDLGGLWIRRIQQFWLTKRTIRVTGDVLMPDIETNNMLRMINDDGKITNFVDISKDDLDGDYDIDVYAGSTMQSNKSAITQMVIQLAQTPAEDGLPMLDRKTVLENVIDSIGQINIQEVLDYYENMKQQQAQAQQDSMAQEQEAMAMEQQAQMQQEQQKQAMEQDKHAMDMQGKQIDLQHKMKEHEMKMQQEQMKTLQNMQNDVQYGVSGQDFEGVSKEQDFTAFIEQLLSLPQDEYNKALSENPELESMITKMLEEE